MNNKKSLLQDSLQELENIKNESLELAKEQLINESADLLEKKSAALFEKLIANEEDDKEEEEDDEKDEEKPSKKEKKSRKDESSYINEMLNELKDLDSEEEEDIDDSDEEDDMDSDEEEMDSDEEEMDSDEEEMSLDALRKAAEEQGFKLVQADSDEEEVDDSDDEEEMDDSDDEEDIEFGDEESDEDEFMTTNVDNKVLAEPSDEEEDEESLEKINENFKRKNTKMRNTKKQVLKDLRDVSFNKLVEAYYNMGETDSFIIKENEYIEEDSYDEGMNMGTMNPMDEELYDEDYNEGFHSMMDEDLFEDEDYEERYNPMMDETLYEIDMNTTESGYNEPTYDENYELTEEELNDMLEGMDIEDNRMMKRSERASGYKELDEEMFSFFDNDPSMNYNPENEPYKPREFEYPDTKDVLGRRGIGQIGKNPEEFKQMKKDPSLSKYYPVGGPKGPLPESNELEEMFENMTLEELHEMESLLHEDGDDMESIQDGQGGSGMRFKVDPMEDYEEKDLTESQIEEMLAEMGGEDPIEESSLINSQTKMNRGNRGGGNRKGAKERRSGMTSDGESEEFENLQEQVKKLKQENKALNEGFTNKVKSLENKVYDVTISALKAGFVNKFLLEHPLRENEKLQIIHRFTNAQTKEQIKETYISLTNEFAKGQTVKDGSMLNESVQNRVGKVHRTDNVIVTEKNLMNESDESNRFKQLLNYNFNKKK